jgi:tRNA acetyltransferase TAN1
MAEAQSGPSNARKRKYRSDGVSPTWAKRSIEGPGIWATCVKGKEKGTVGELYDLFESLAADMWPIEGHDSSANDRDNGSDAEENEDDLETQIAKEVAALKRPKVEKRFANCLTNTQCVIFMSCKPPVDPVRLVMKHLENVQETGVTRTKYTHRLTPVSGTCVANLPELHSLCRRTVTAYCAQENGEESPKARKYKVELRVRNHNTLTRMEIIQEVAKCMPSNYTVDLDDPDVFVLVEVFKSTFGVSIVEDYYRFQKFNVMELANAHNEPERFEKGAGRVQDKKQEEEDNGTV